MSTRTIRHAYDMWPHYNGRLRDVIGAMTAEQLLVRPSPDRWPIWATVGHTAGMRVYWLCTVIGEPGLDTTPFSDDPTDGWEDHLDHPRSAEELVEALDSTFGIVEACLDRWTPDMLADAIRREYQGRRRSTAVGQSSSASSATMPTTAASGRRRSASTASRRSTSGAPRRRTRIHDGDCPGARLPSPA
jgi:hypothetical protein